LHAGIFGEAQHRRSVGQSAGRAGRHAGETKRAALNIDLDRTNGASAGSDMTRRTGCGVAR
jgi:hypothetical protein